MPKRVIFSFSALALVLCFSVSCSTAMHQRIDEHVAINPDSEYITSLDGRYTVENRKDSFIVLQ